MTSRTSVFLCIGSVLFGGSVPIVAADSTSRQPSSIVLEIARFDVDRENYTTKSLERAGKIPDETLDDLQRALLGEFTRAGLFKTVRKPVATPDSTNADAAGSEADSGSTDDAESAKSTESVLVISGTITDFKPGNRGARMLIGFGAGGQKFEVDCVLMDWASGKKIGEATIVDRKFGGITGGDEAKGRSDFAEKVVKFVKKSLDLD